MRIRHQYRLDLTKLDGGHEGIPAWLTLRHPTLGDVDALATLLLNSYKGTVDDEGETIAEAREFAECALTENTLFEASWLVVDRSELPLCAIVIQRWRGEPLVGFVITDSNYKNCGLGRNLVQRAMLSLRRMGEAVAVAFITEGNSPSERLFARLGFGKFVPSPF